MFINQSSSFPKLSHIYESTHRSIPSISEAFLNSATEPLLSITLEAFPIKVYEVLLNSSKHDTDKTSYTHHHVSPLNTQQWYQQVLVSSLLLKTDYLQLYHDKSLHLLDEDTSFHVYM